MQQPTEQPVSDPPTEAATPASPSESLAWLPATSAAISLRLFAIDAAIIYRPGDLPGRDIIQVNARADPEYSAGVGFPYLLWA